MDRLGRFVKAQEEAYQTALLEVKSGQKQGHWIWFVFPQMKGLGHSRKSDYYGIESIEEASNYLNHPVLGSRIREITQALLDLPSYLTAEKIFGGLDSLKVQSSMTLFYCISKEDLFLDVIDRFYNGFFDTKTWYKFEANYAKLRSLYLKHEEECEKAIESLGYYKATRTVDVTTIPFSFDINGQWYLLDGFCFKEKNEFYALVADLQTGPPDILEVDAIAIPDDIIQKVLSILNEKLMANEDKI